MPFETDKLVEMRGKILAQELRSDSYIEFIGEGASPIFDDSQVRVASESAIQGDSNINESKYKRDCSVVFKYMGPGGRDYEAYPPFHPYPRNFPSQNPKVKNRLIFYYMNFDENGALHTRRFSEQLGHISYQQTIQILTEKARRSPWEASDDIGDENWNGPCLVAFFLDDPAWTLIDFSESGFVGSHSIHFASGTWNVLDEEDCTDGPDGTWKPRTHSSNISFFNARNESMLGTDYDRKYLIVENHHLTFDSSESTCVRRRKNGETKTDHYKYDLYFRVAIRGISPRTKKLTLVIDPGGRNTGP